MRSPALKCAPSWVKQTMRRATRPAICTTPNRPERALDDDAVALVVLARLVEIGVEEKAGVIGDALDAALDRRAIHMAVEHRHEDRHALQRPHAEPELGRRRGEAGEADDAVGRRDDEIGADRRHAGGIAEEIGAPERRDEAEPAERRPNPPQDQRRDDEAGDEDIALADGSARDCGGSN